MQLDLSDRDKLMIANALSLCPVSELGDRVGGNDSETAQRLVELAAMFDVGISEEMSMFRHQFKGEQP